MKRTVKVLLAWARGNKYIIGSAILASLLFWLNAYHMKEQGVFLSKHAVLAKNLLFANQYSYGDGEWATYPMWGYPMLVAFLQWVARVDWTFAFQYILLLGSLLLVYREFATISRDSTFRKGLFAGILFSYAMLLSVKWPDAIIGFCVLLFGICHRRKNYVCAASILLLGYHFRPESLLFFAAYVVYLLVKERHIVRMAWLRITLVTILLLSPWPIFQYTHHGHFLLTATNMGGVLYISLGQLPGNKWNREHKDQRAGEYAASQGIDNPWGIEGNNVLRRRFLQDVRSEPLEYARKCALNFTRILSNGLYVTEFIPLTGRVDWEARRAHQDNYEKYKASPRLFLRDLVKFETAAVQQVPRITLQVLSILFLLTLLVYSTYLAVRKKSLMMGPFALIVFAQFILSTMIQYQPRHTSHVIILFLFMIFPRKQLSDGGE